jgi:amino acid adenylation domain-containing protein
MASERPVQIAEAFAAQAAASHDRQAVCARDGSLTYAQLHDASSALARTLVDRGTQPGQVIPIFTGRTLALPVGILGILKAGAAYLPIDPAHPGARLNHLVRQAAAQTVITTRELAGQARERLDTGALTQVVVDTSEAPVHTGDDDWIHRFESSLSYVLPTSGSTGQPKGVQVEDRHVLDLVKALDEAILSDLGPALRISLVAPYIFDASVQQIFSALLLGHTLFIVPEDIRTDGGRLRSFWHDERIDVSDGTPAHLHMVSHVRSGPLVNVRRLIIGGDVLSKDVVQEFYKQCASPLTRIINIYGVSECSVDSIAGQVTPSADIDPPIGVSLPGATVEVIGDNLEPVADGESGELCISGSRVGRGYLGDPVLTAQRFVPCPNSPGERMYLTGDIGMRSRDDKFSFIQRKDRQIKIRGHRIEPREIENALRRYSPPAADSNTVASCERCLLTTAYPKVEVTNGICSVCSRFEDYRSDAEAYFRDTDELIRLITTRSNGASYDVLLLFSGGKDSTYALYRLLDFGLRVLAFTFDNGYISQGAFRNIRRITEQLGVDLEIGQVQAMDEVFKESLRADSTVCSGCFRGLTTLSTHVALERGIPAVVTGLSRGQIYDTKLRMLFEAGIRDPEEIESRLMTHRKLYQARRDRTSELIAQQVSQSVLDDMLFLDYFRYDDVRTAQIKEYLATRDLSWKNPTDTGLCSTNCRINDVGIYVHSLERGYHNYASPLSWDCRLGVVSREDGLRELADVMPRDDVIEILEKLGYSPAAKEVANVTDAVVMSHGHGLEEADLWAYYTCTTRINPEDLHSYLSRALPSYMIPSRFFRVDKIPVTDTGKVDYGALPTDAGSEAIEGEGPRDETEYKISAIWARILKVKEVPRDADFFELGGNSIRATVAAGMIEQEFGVSLPVADLFAVPTVAGNAAGISNAKHRSEGG